MKITSRQKVKVARGRARDELAVVRDDIGKTSDPAVRDRLCQHRKQLLRFLRMRCDDPRALPTARKLNFINSEEYLFYSGRE